MLAIRLQRVGRKNDPSFRIIVQDHRRSPKKTRGLVEFVGSYDARKGNPQVNGERIKYWMGMGAQPSATVHNILVDTKVITGKKVNAMNKKTKVVKEAPKEEPKKAAPVAEAKAEEAATPEAKVVEEAPVAEAAPEVKVEEPMAEEAAPLEAPTEEAKAEETPAA